MCGIHIHTICQLGAFAMTIYKATPRVITNGIKDLSRRPIVREPEQLPQHLPLVFLLAERGPDTPHVAGGDSFLQLYGDETLNFRSKFVTHQSVLFDYINREGNMCMIQRIIPTNAKKALLRVSAEVIPALVPLYERNTDGTYKIDANTGLPIQETYPVGHPNAGQQVFVVGHRIIWHIGTSEYPASITIGSETINPRDYGKGIAIDGYRLGTVTVSGEQLSTLLDAGSNPVASKLYPIMDLEVSHHGDYGNRIGLALSAPNSKSLQPGDVNSMNILGSYLYRFRSVERQANLSTSFNVETVAGETTIDLGFKKKIYNPQTNVALSFLERFVPSYQVLNNPAIVPLYGPFGRSHVYGDNLTAILQLLAQTGVAVNGTQTTITEGSYDNTAFAYGRTANIAFQNKPANLHLLNIFTGVDQNNVPYFTFDVSKSVKFGGVGFGENNVHYASGGSDGLYDDVFLQPNMLANLKEFDEGVYNFLDTFGETSIKMLDVAKYPCRAVWDSGFSLRTKKKFLTPVARRKDIFAFLSTQSVAEYADTENPTSTWDYRGINTSTDETAIATILRNVALATPESFIDGTPACRAAIVGRTGYLIDHDYKEPLPIIIDLANKVAKYWGAANGYWTAGQSFDDETRNIVSLFRDINITYQNPATYDNEWDAGLIWVQNYDRTSQFYPAFQTVSPDDTSVLNSVVTAFTCCILEAVAQAAWRRLSGNTSLTREQFIERSNAIINDLTQGRFDGRFTIVPETYFDEADANRGYSYSTRIHIYANNMITVNRVTIVAHRLSDLAQ